jgi:small-conductance mechanosensitive channel
VAVLLHLLALAIAAGAFWLAYRWRRHDDGSASRLAVIIVAAVLMALAAALQQTVGVELQVTGPVLRVFEILWTAVFTAGALLFASGILRLSADMFVALAKLRARPSDEHVIRLAFRALALVVAIGLLVAAAQRLGVPVSGIVTGLGVGGIAVALAAQTTLQNLLGGVILVTDRPLRVGDFCSYGDRVGTLEAIGLRSSRIRSLDRTLVTIPNADLAALHIENYAFRDRILLKTDFGLRYETRPDQLRCVLADIRAMLIAHPKVFPEPARARFTGMGQSSLDIKLFAYVRTADFNEFLGIREDLMLRIIDIVERAGASFAIPSQIVYLRRDAPPNEAAVEAAEAKVAQWRQTGMLPFPEFETGQRGELTDTLPYPPEGSPHAATHPTP